MKTHAYTATVRWGRDGAVSHRWPLQAAFLHTWRFDGGIELAGAPASPHVVRLACCLAG